MQQPKSFTRAITTGLLSGAVVLSMVATAFAEPDASTTKNLSTNFTLVNLEAAANSGSISYYKDNGSQWRQAESFQFAAEGDQLIKRQYDAGALPTSGAGSVVVSASGKLGAVVQILARDGQVDTSGAYSGATAGAASMTIPLTTRKLNTASGASNSQIYVQNTGNDNATVEIEMINPDGTSRFKKTGITLAVGQATNYDLNNEVATNIPDGWFGSAVVRATNQGGSITAVSNLFTGADGMQTFNGFANKAQNWKAPLFLSRLSNGLNSPVAVQNLSGQQIPVGGIKLNCKKDAASPGNDFNVANTTAVGNTASYFFNPVTDQAIPAGFFGACTIDTTGFDTVAFVQLRYVKIAGVSPNASDSQAAAYEGIPGNGTNKKVTVPLYAKRLGNGFASAVTIQNLNNSAPATVNLVYKGGAGAPANCSLTKNGVSIPAGGSLIQNHRVESGAGAVPEIGNGCFGTLVVTSTDQPIDAFVQLTDVSGRAGDTFMAHNAFTSP